MFKRSPLHLIRNCTIVAAPGVAEAATCVGNHTGFTDCTTTASVNIRGCSSAPSTSCTIYRTDPANFSEQVFCYTYGQSINGDNVWYNVASSQQASGRPPAWIAGYYLNTGHDPNPTFDNCSVRS